MVWVPVYRVSLEEGGDVYEHYVLSNEITRTLSLSCKEMGRRYPFEHHHRQHEKTFLKVAVITAEHDIFPQSE